ncbi:transketolase [Saccharomycopsis crataegensis]|uniref:Transketolase n=1 Tax=Saccharomycopsis crataegensis TaxID=43959 RepID=A0AAV5QIC9_9ASCO|nr:transketolase [Saccharomycopsis crataegensis]
MSDIDNLAISTIRLLAVDQVAAANSGHPGAPLGLAQVAHIIFKNMIQNPASPDWLNKDRFVLSNGHSVALLYSLLHLAGYPLSIEDLKQFRHINSKTPGHPEAETPGIDVTTGPLGQGICNAVGLALAQEHIAARFNKPGFEISNNYTYCILGDGCMMEGVASEACSLAGHLKLSKLIAFYDDNHISIDGDTNVAFTEDVNKRYEAYGWEVLWVKDGMHDYEGITKAIEQAKKSDKPTLIRVTTIIGYGSKMQGTHSVHGAPLKADDIVQLKTHLGFDPSKSFVVPEEVYSYYKSFADSGAAAEAKWSAMLKEYSSQYPELGAELKRRIAGELPADLESILPTFTAADKAVATRKLSEGVISKLYDAVPELIGGSADLTGSNLTRAPDAVDFQPPSTGLGDYSGRYIRFGVREHGMAAICNGISAYGANFISFGATFMNFVSYAVGAVRLSALSGHHVLYVATHDSIGLGEDGPTHQPIETLTHLRSIPNLSVWRPADGNETSAAYLVALKNKHTPSVLAFSRQNLPQLAGSSIAKASKGGYVVHGSEAPVAAVVATGSEVGIAVEAAELLAKEGVNINVISLPDWFTFDAQPKDYKLSIFPDGLPVMSFEVLSTNGWSKYAHEHFGLDRFGISGKGPDVYKYFEFTGEGVAKRVKKVVDFYKGTEVKSRLNTAL